MRLCVVCQASVGPGTAFIEDDDCAKLTALQHAPYAPRRTDATWYACRDCKDFCIGIDSRLSAFHLMVATGLFFTARRLYGDMPQHTLEVVRANLDNPTFKNTRHGAADYRMDRCSLMLPRKRR